MANVLHIYTADKCAFTPQQALEDAMKQHTWFTPFKHVIIIGEFEGGELFVRSSRLKKADANWLIDRAKDHALREQREIDGGE